MRRQTYSPELNQDIYTSNRKHNPMSPKVDSMYQTTNIVFDKLKSDNGLRAHHKGKLITNSVVVSTEKDTPKMSGSQNEIISDALLARRILQQNVPANQEEINAQLPSNHLHMHSKKYNDDKRKKVTSFDDTQKNKNIEQFNNTERRMFILTPDKERSYFEQNTTSAQTHAQYLKAQFQSENVTVKGVSVTVKLPNKRHQTDPSWPNKKTNLSNVGSNQRLESSQESSFKTITDGPNSEQAASNSYINTVQSATTPSVFLKITKNDRKGDTWVQSEQRKRNLQVDTLDSLSSTLNSHRNVVFETQSQNNSERGQQTMHLKMCLKKFMSLKDPVSTIKKITDGTDASYELGIPASRHSTRRNISILNSKRPISQENGMVKTIKIIDDSLETSKIASGQEHAFQQSKQLGDYQNPQQYNGANCTKFMYPTFDNFKSLKKIVKNNKLLQAVTMQTNRDRSIDIAQLTYHEQKEFFRLDKAYEKTFVQKHEQKVKKSSDQLSIALMANLKRERINIFKQFLNEDESRKIDYNKTQFNSKVPFLRTPKLRVLMNGDEVQVGHDALLQQRDDILMMNHPFRQRQIRKV